MTQSQFLIFLIAIIPPLNCLISKLCEHSTKLVELANKALPVLFLVNLIGFYGSNDDSYLTLAEPVRGIALGFAIDRMALGFLFLLSFFWLSFVFYSHRFLQLSAVKNSAEMKMFFNLIIAFVNLVIISKNLLSILFFYNCLVLLCHFFAVRFLHKKETKFSSFFTFLLYLESIFFFLAIVATYRFSGQIDFTPGGVISPDLDYLKYMLLLALYLSGLFLSTILPCYLLYRNINFDPLIIYALFFLSYALSSLYIFIKILLFIFGVKGFGLMISRLGFGFVEIIFLANIAAASFFLIRSSGLKTSFFYLFFQQFLFTLFSIIAFATFDESRILLSAMNFLFSVTLMFFCISNFSLYLAKAESKQFAGLFYELKVTSIFFIFALLNMAGPAPGIGAVEKFFLIKAMIKNGLGLSALIFLVNFITLGLFAWKTVYPLFLRLSEPRLAADAELAKNIDFDSSLILTGLVTALAMFLLLILFPLAVNFFN